MRGGIVFFQFGEAQMGVYLCGGYGGVSEKFFDGIYSGSVVEQGGGEGVPQHVRAFFGHGGVHQFLSHY